MRNNTHSISLDGVISDRIGRVEIVPGEDRSCFANNVCKRVTERKSMKTGQENNVLAVRAFIFEVSILRSTLWLSPSNKNRYVPVISLPA